MSWRNAEHQLQSLRSSSVLLIDRQSAVPPSASFCDRSELICLPCRLAKWDMRTSEGVVQDLGSPVVGYESGKDYSRGTNFTCMATTGAALAERRACALQELLLLCSINKCQASVASSSW